jgi:hypothetical protein
MKYHNKQGAFAHLIKVGLFDFKNMMIHFEFKTF